MLSVVAVLCWAVLRVLIGEASLGLGFACFNTGFRRFLRRERVPRGQGAQFHEACPAPSASEPHLLAGHESRRHHVRGERGRPRYRRAKEGAGRGGHDVNPGEFERISRSPVPQK